MISITVHHHHHNPHSPIGACVGTPEQLPALPTVDNKPTTISANSSSNVEVQYLARYFRPLQQQQPQRILGELQGSTEMNQKQELDFDLNNNLMNEHNDAKQVEDDIRLKKLDTSPITNHRPMKLHSRSISLIINPEFCNQSNNGDNGSSNSKPLCRRRSLPRLKRRTRLQLHDYSKLATDSAQTSNTQQVASENRTGDSSMRNNGNQSWDSMKKEEQLLRLSCSVSVPEFIPKLTESSTTMQATITTSNTSTPDSEAKFREAGILLREISDEFARCRRRTI